MSEIPNSEQIEQPQAMKRARIAAPVVGLALFLASLFVLHRELQSTPLKAISSALAGLPVESFALAGLFAIIAYIGIAFYDVLALRYTSEGSSFPRAAFASATSYATSNFVGFGVLSANVVRLNLYTRWGLSAPSVGTLAIVTGLALAAGGLATAGLALLMGADQTTPILHGAGAHAAGLVLIGLVLIGVFAMMRLPKEGRLFGASFIRPPPAIPAMQVLFAMLDWVATAAILWVLLPEAARPDLFAFLPIFVLASILGGVSGLPGGMGAFEAAILLMTPSGNEAPVVAALIGFRVIYYLVPFLLTAAAFVWMGRKSVSGASAAIHRHAQNVAVVIAPSLLAVIVFVAGALVLLQAALPVVEGHLGVLAELAPQRLVDVSHFGASLVGAVLIIAAFGLWSRVNTAWIVSTGLLGVAAILTLLSGGGLATAIFLIAISGLMWISRGAFYRPGGLADVSLSATSLAVIGALLMLFVWTGAMAYRHVDLRADLFWSFALNADASRFLRALFGVSILFAVFLVWRALRPIVEDDKPDAPDVGKVRTVLANADTGHADANLALLGDKHLFFSESGRSYIQYGIRSRRFVVMGEPVGAASEIEDLLWKFREYADNRGASLVFYSIGVGLLPHMIDLGLAVQKIGEAAHVPLAGFGLEGSGRAELRQARNRAIRDGVSFRIAPVEEVPQLLDMLERVSDEWLSEHQGTEKGFSLGGFDRTYLSSFPIALVERDGQPVAFANIWQTADKRELSVDLMRYGDDAPRGVMDYLFTELALWGKEQGYRVLDLGMAPLAGVEGHRLAPLVSRIGSFVYEHGNALYGFQGLRSYKDKFDPKWEPLYLAAQSRTLLAIGLSDVALLTSGGLVGMLRHERG